MLKTVLLLLSVVSAPAAQNFWTWSYVAQWGSGCDEGCFPSAGEQMHRVFAFVPYTYTVATRPAPIGNDYYYDVGQVAPMLIVAPWTPGVYVQVPGGAPNHDALFCDPNPLATAFPPSGGTIFQGRPTGGAEPVDDYRFTPPAPGPLVGTTWAVQWSRLDPTNGLVYMSNAVLLTAR